MSNHKSTATFNPSDRYVRAVYPVPYVAPKYDPATDPDLQRCPCTNPNDPKDCLKRVSNTWGGNLGYNACKESAPRSAA